MTQAVENAAIAEQDVDRQRAVVADLERRGASADDALRQLAHLEASLDSLIAKREWFRVRLEWMRPPV